VVDEKLWNSEDEDEGKDQGQDQKQEQYDDNGSIAVDDKKDLDYEVRPVLRIMLVQYKLYCYLKQYKLYCYLEQYKLYCYLEPVPAMRCRLSLLLERESVP